MAKTNKYDESSIVTLEGLEHIRKRPGMYVPSELDKRLLHLLWEILDNSIDEMTSGHAKKITLKLYKDGSASVEDNGRGIPNKKIIDSFTKTNTSGKFNDNNYKNSVGTNGIGQKATNAFSDRLQVEVKQDGKIYTAEFHNFGKIKQDLKVTGETKSTGTYVRFWPDKQTFKGLSFDAKEIIDRLSKLKYLVKNFNVDFIDERTGDKQTFINDSGLEGLLKEITSKYKLIHNTPFKAQETSDLIEAEVMFQWTNAGDEIAESFVNYVNTKDGGTHVNGVRYALPPIINKIARDWKLLKDKEDDLITKDIDEGLAIVVSCKMSQSILMFGSQTKEKLTSPEANSFIQKIIKDNFQLFANKHKNEVKEVISRIILNRNARLKAKETSDSLKQLKKDPKKDKTLSGKLAKCSGKNFKENELFLCEGDSAGGQLITGRNKETQAILPLRGKVINSHKCSIKDVIANQELITIINTIDAGIGKDFNVKNARYGKIIITADADEDGNHIASLLITFFWNYMRPLLTNGMVYCSLTPLFKIKNKRTNEYKYAYSNQEFEEMRKKIKMGDYEVNRFKGLGELDEAQLIETALDPETRRMIQLSIKDESEFQQALDILMGDDSTSRREWITNNVDFSKLD